MGGYSSVFFLSFLFFSFCLSKTYQKKFCGRPLADRKAVDAVAEKLVTARSELLPPQQRRAGLAGPMQWVEEGKWGGSLRNLVLWTLEHAACIC